MNELCVFLYNFEVNRIQTTTSNSPPIISCLSVATETCVNFVAMLWFPQAYPLLWKCVHQAVVQQWTSLRCFSACILPVFSIMPQHSDSTGCKGVQLGEETHRQPKSQQSYLDSDDRTHSLQEWSHIQTQHRMEQRNSTFQVKHS
jgi:hypothetical protein